MKKDFVCQEDFGQRPRPSKEGDPQPIHTHIFVVDPLCLSFLTMVSALGTIIEVVVDRDNPC